MRIANEKTLELNIIHQLLSDYRNSFAIGTDQRAEARSGVDSGIQIPYRAVLFQFKASNLRKVTESNPHVPDLIPYLFEVSGQL
jgi:hypothetical protein